MVPVPHFGELWNLSAIKEIISCLIESGMDPAEAAILMAEAGAEMAFPGREKSSAALRQQRYRDRIKRNESVTERNGVTPVGTVTNRNETVTNRNGVTSAISFLDSKKEKKERAATGKALHDDWKPDEKDFEYGKALGLNRREVDGMAEDMRLWARANANRAVGRKADWRSTFHGWMRREAPKIIRQRNRPSSGLEGIA
jgi:hypothetical protein